MFKSYQKIARRYRNLPLKKERELLSLAKKGNNSAKDKLIYCQIGFFLFRINTILFPVVLRRYGEDIMQDCIEFATRKIFSYNLRYRNKHGVFQPVYFRTYLWKGITGIIIGSIKKRKEILFSDMEGRNEQF